MATTILVSRLIFEEKFAAILGGLVLELVLLCNKNKPERDGPLMVGGD